MIDRTNSKKYTRKNRGEFSPPLTDTIVRIRLVKIIELIKFSCFKDIRCLKTRFDIKIIISSAINWTEYCDKGEMLRMKIRKTVLSKATAC